MSDKQINQSLTKKKSKSKRKVISPLQNEGHKGLGAGITCDEQVHKRIYTPGCDVLTPTYNNINMNSMSTNMSNMASPGNFQQSYCGIQQSPQGHMYPPTPSQGAYSQQQMQSTPIWVSQQSTPVWATDLINDVKSLKLSSQNVEKTVNTINLKMSEFETKLVKLETKVNEVETACTFISSEYDRQRNELSTAREEIKNLKKSCSDLEIKTLELEKQKHETNSKLIDLETRSMNENLIFYGIPEQVIDKNSSAEPEQEDCVSLVKELIKTHMRLDADTMTFDRVHRLGPQNSKKPRAIVAKFHYYSEREQVRKQSYDKDIKKALKDAERGVGVQRPQVARDARKALADVIKEQEDLHNSVKLIGCKLFVNGKLHKLYSDGKVIDPPPYMLSARR